MERRIEDVQYCERLFQSFYDIGSTSQGGVTRLGYSEAEDAMHEVFKGLGRELGASVITDEVGNTYVTNTDEDGYTRSAHIWILLLRAAGMTEWLA